MWNHDVFLSFRGEDTRNTFTKLLYNALIHAGLYTFFDDDQLPRGQQISSQLLKAIHGSRISIVIFSRNYASSQWCLDELVEIMECRKSKGQLVFPVFYDVDPSHVRRQTEGFADAFEKHRKRLVGEGDKLEKWRRALIDAANLSGWALDLQNVADGHEVKFIQNIVDKVLLEVDHKPMNIVYQVGIDSRIAAVNSLLTVGSNDVRVIGIYGTGGIGKTTIVKAVYNQIYQQFEGSCFLENVKDALEVNDLQDQLLSKLLRMKNLVVGNVDRIGFIRARLRSKKVLIVLDDVDKLSQINSLAGHHNWFGSGSRIIITSRDEHLFNQVDVNGRYEVKLLDENESSELFSMHAFRNCTILEGFIELSNSIISYAGGLPLALEVLGSYLLGRTIVEWQSALDKLEKIPLDQIQQKLEISFNALDDDYVKDIFLDIACFFIGEDKDFVVTILNSCGFFTEIGLKILISRCLLTLNEKNELMMHDLIRDMGREIVRRQSPKEPGKRSRLWFLEDICEVLEKDKGTEVVEGIVVKYPLSKCRHLSTKAFEKMERLRLLQIDYLHLSGNFEHFPTQLKWLCWKDCPLKCLPPDFHLEELVILDMQLGKIKKLWYGIKCANNLKILNLNHCQCLSVTPDFTGVPRLEKLLLEGCTSLLTVHPSIGILASLVYLTLKRCENLVNLPNSICELRSLEYLNVSGCLKLEKLPDNVGNMISLQRFSAKGTSIKQLPESIVLLKNLRSLSLKAGNKRVPAKAWFSLLSSWLWRRKSPTFTRLLPHSVSGLSSLQKLVLRDCNLPDGSIPVDLGSLYLLKVLDLAGNSCRTLPFSLNQLSKLEKLLVNDCRNLQSIPQLPCNLEELMANNCSSLEKLSNLSNFKQVPHLYLAKCRELAEIEGLKNLNAVRMIDITECGNLAATFLDHFFQGYSEHSYVSDMYLPRGDIPDWFYYQTEGPSITFEMPLNVENKLQGITFWAVYDLTDLKVQMHFPIVVIKDKTNNAEVERWADFGINREDGVNHSWVSHVPLSCFKCPVKGGETIEVSFRMDLPLKMKKCAIHLIYKPGSECFDQGREYLSADMYDDALEGENSAKKKCHCGIFAPTWTAWTQDNPGRRFIGCSRYKERRSCGYFEWCDPELTERGRQLILSLREDVMKLKHEAEVERLETGTQQASEEWDEERRILEEMNGKLKNEVSILVSKEKYFVWAIVVISLHCLLVQWCISGGFWTSTSSSLYPT